MRAQCLASVGQAERRVSVRREQDRVGRDAEPPAEDPHDEVEQRPGIAPGDQDGEPGNDHAGHGRDGEQAQDDEVRDGEEPLDQRQPAVGLQPGIGVHDSQMDGLLLVG